MATYHPLKNIETWRKGCSCSLGQHPATCQECTDGLVKAIEDWFVEQELPRKRTFLVAWELSVAHVETGERRQFTQTAFIELQPGEVFGPAKVSEVQKIVLQGMVERDPRLLQLRATAQVVSFQQLEDE